MLPRVVQVYSTGDDYLVVHFDDGKVVRWDARPLRRQGGVFERLRDPDVFRNQLTVLNGTVAWSEDFNPETCLDVDPLVIYREGEDITGREWLASGVESRKPHGGSD
jgi:hypothetical protein